MAAGSGVDTLDVYRASRDFSLKLRRGVKLCLPAQLDAEKINDLVQAGPQFIGAFCFAPIPHPRKEGEQRHVCLLQVPSAPGEEISSETLAALEYRVEVERESVERRLDTEWRTALAHQEDQKDNTFFEGTLNMLLERDASPISSPTGNFEICDSLVELEEWDIPDKTTVDFETLDDGSVSASSQGKRWSMEDAHCSKVFFIECAKRTLQIRLSAIYDGHAGPLCAQLMAEHFDAYLKIRLERHNQEELTLEGTWNALKFAFVDFTRTYQSYSGSCANVACEIEGMGLFVANVGDARTFLVTEDGHTFQLTEDQKIPRTPYCSFDETPPEAPPPSKYEIGNLHRGCAPCGGRVHGLNIARTIGDKGGKDFTIQYLSARPKIVMPTKERLEAVLERPLREGEPVLLVQACDGLFDVGSTAQYGKLISSMIGQRHSLAKVAASCIEAAYVSGSRDNLTMKCRWVTLT